jgi:hypothetical protein
MEIDECMETILNTLNQFKELITLQCCCGHVRYHKSIVVRHKQTRKVFEFYSGIRLATKKSYYVKDTNTGLYYIPQLEKHYENHPLIFDDFYDRKDRNCMEELKRRQS